jgi:pyruvate/2-oxoacid:ferredoxin oxidoreductase beta subunit
MEQVEAIRILAQAAKRSDALVVSDIGSQTVWLHATGDEPSYLYLTGPMGLAASVALGVSLATPSRAVLAICGDGGLSMCLNSLVTIASQAPPNLTVSVMDNGVYDFTGKLAAPSTAINWEGLVAGLPSFRWYELLHEASNPELSAARGLGFIRAMVEPARMSPPRFLLEPSAIHKRFLSAVQSFRS